MLIDWFCKGGSHRFSQQHESSSPVSPTSPLHRDGRTSKSPEPTHDEENALLEKKEHPVQTESLGTSLEPVLKIQEQDPMELLPDSPPGGPPQSGPLKPPVTLSKRSSASSSSSSSSANGRSSMSGPRLAVPGAESQSANRDDASSISSSVNNDAPDLARSSASSSNAGEDDAAAAAAAGADDDPTNVDDDAVGPYVFVAKERLLGIYVSVFVLKSAHHLLSDVAKSRVTAGLLGGRMGNKGAAAVAVHFAGLRFLFLSAHLAAHQTNVSARKQNIVKIKEELDIDHFSDHIEDEQLREQLEDLDDVTDRFDACFWFGDLNFRLDISRLHADWLLQSKSYNVLLEFDQLKTLLKERNSCLKGFREAPIDFAPTYKVSLSRPNRASDSNADSLSYFSMTSFRRRYCIGGPRKPTTLTSQCHQKVAHSHCCLQMGSSSSLHLPAMRVRQCRQTQMPVTLRPSLQRQRRGPNPQCPVDRQRRQTTLSTTLVCLYQYRKRERAYLQ